MRNSGQQSSGYPPPYGDSDDDPEVTGVDVEDTDEVPSAYPKPISADDDGDGVPANDSAPKPKKRKVNWPFDEDGEDREDEPELTEDGIPTSFPRPINDDDDDDDEDARPRSRGNFFDDDDEDDDDEEDELASQRRRRKAQKASGRGKATPSRKKPAARRPAYFDDDDEDDDEEDDRMLARRSRRYADDDDDEDDYYDGRREGLFKRLIRRWRERSERIDRLEIEGLEQEILDPDEANLPKLISQDGVIRFGLLFGLGGFIVFMLWATLVPLSEGVIASGLVAVESQRKTVQHLEGGIVAELLVEEGSLVKAGDLLVQLDTTQPKARHELLQTRYYNTLALLDRLKAERFETPNIVFNDELQTRLDDPNIADIVEQHGFLFEARRNQFSGQRSIQQRRISQLRAQVAGISSQFDAKERERQLTTFELDRLQSLRKRDNRLVTVTQLVAQQKSLNQVDSDLGALQAEIARTNVAISEAQLQLSQIDLTLKQEISTELLSAKEQLFEIREQLAATQDVLRRTQVLSPQNGTVFGLRIFTVGGVVPPAEPIMEIVPNDDKLVIEVRIRTTDIDDVQPNQAVRARFSAFNARNTPEVNGTVVSIRPDAEIDPATQESYYSAIVTIPEEEMSRLVGIEVIPGMPVEVFVTGGERTAIDYLLKPITDAARKSLVEG